MVCGLAIKLLKIGVPLHPAGGGGTGVGGMGVGAPGTLMTTSKRTPKGTPFDACSCQTLVCVPGVTGAVMLIEMLIMLPGLAAGMGCGEDAPNASPSTNKTLYPPPHAQVPEF